jgi:hypothetical protein
MTEFFYFVLQDGWMMWKAICFLIFAFWLPVAACLWIIKEVFEMWIILHSNKKKD